MNKNQKIRAITLKIDSNFDDAYKRLLSELRQTEKIISQQPVKDENGNSSLVVIIENNGILLG